MSRKGEADEKCNEVLRGMLCDWMAEQRKRGKRHASYEAMARASGFSNCYLHRLSTGSLRRGFSFAVAIEILKVLGVSLTDFEQVLEDTP